MTTRARHTCLHTTTSSESCVPRYLTLGRASSASLSLLSSKIKMRKQNSLVFGDSSEKLKRVKKLRKDGAQMNGKREIVQMVGRTRKSQSLRLEMEAMVVEWC